MAELPAGSPLKQVFQETARTLESDFETCLTELAADTHPRLAEAMRYAVLGGGKRLRPLLLRQSYALSAPDASSPCLAPAIGRAALALECVHCYSLIHDDLPAMDDDDWRRGRPAAHRAFDEATAILAGDALLTLAFAILGDGPLLPVSSEVRCDLVLILARAGGGMVDGQMRDIDFETKTAKQIGRMEYWQMLERKTGALIEASCLLGARLAGCVQDSPKSRALQKYAGKLGLAFQLRDDILDAIGDPSLMGKKTGKDHQKRKLSAISMLGLDEAKAEAHRLAGEAKAELAIFDRRRPAYGILAALSEFVVRRVF